MADKHCIHCGGTGFLVNGQPCTYCSSSGGYDLAEANILDIPVQYQNYTFNQAELPSDLQNVYGPWMTNKLEQILSNPAQFQENFIIASRANSGKTIWAYTLLRGLAKKGFFCPTLIDIIDVRDFYRARYAEDESKWFDSRCLIVKLPRLLEPWSYDMIEMLIEKRVRKNGFTIFLFPGSSADIEMQDKFKHFIPLIGDGTFNSIHVYSFYS